MSASTATIRRYERTKLQTIVSATLIAGSLDITAAFISSYARGTYPIKVLYFIASGVFGKDIAYNNGVGMAVLVLCLHYLIAFLFTLLLFFVYSSVKSFL